MAFDVSILGLGDNVVDRYEPEGVMYPGGNAVNCAVFARRAGAARAAYMGIFGNDAASEHVIASLAEEGIECVKCRQVIGECGKTTVRLAGGERVFLESNLGGVRGRTRIPLDRFDLEYIKGFDVVHLGAYGLMERELPTLHRVGCLVSFDFSEDSPNVFIEEHAPFVDIAFFSAEDQMDDQEVRERLAWLAGLGPRVVVATRGMKGSAAYADGSVWLQPAVPAESVVDTMGAGDSFIAAFLLGCAPAIRARSLDGDVIERSLSFAAEFASGACSLEGAWGHPLSYRE